MHDRGYLFLDQPGGQQNLDEGRLISNRQQRMLSKFQGESKISVIVIVRVMRGEYQLLDMIISSVAIFTSCAPELIVYTIDKERRQVKSIGGPSHAARIFSINITHDIVIVGQKRDQGIQHVRLEGWNLERNSDLDRGTRY
jgi:hypothetical protein